jgi:hypothetical protein
LAINELVLERFQVCLLQLELELEGTIREASTPLEQGDCLVEEILKGHHQPSIYP